MFRSVSSSLSSDSHYLCFNCMWASNYLRGLTKTLKPSHKLSFIVIDKWCLLLNKREYYKTPEVAMCLYLDISLSIFNNLNFNFY